MATIHCQICEFRRAIARGASDRDFGEDRSAGGFYVGVTAKLSGLLDGFGTQPNAPLQQRESAIEVSNVEVLEEDAVPAADSENAPLIEEQIIEEQRSLLTILRPLSCKSVEL